MGKALLLIGLLIAGLGLLVMLGAPIGRLPGDFYVRRGSFSFDDAVLQADRVTIAVTLYAVLELHKQGELSWTQDEPFGEITIAANGARAAHPEERMTA